MNDQDKTKEQLIAELVEIRRRTKDAENKRKRLSMMLDQLPAQVYLIATDYSFRYANQLFRDHFNDPEGDKCYKIFYGRTEPCPACSMSRSWKDKQCEQGEYAYPNGKTYQIFDYPFTDCDGTLLQLNFGLDITAQKKAEAAFLQSEEKFYKAFHGNPVPMSITKLKDGLYVEVNDALLRISGYERNEIIGHSSLELNVLSFPETWDYCLEQIHANGSIPDLEIYLNLKSGEKRVFIISGETIDIDGEPHLICCMRDINDQKIMEESLRLSAECLSKAFNAVPIPMIISTLEEGRFIKVNRAFINIMRIEDEEAIGKSSLELGFWADPADRELIKQKLIASQSVQEMEIYFIDNTGERRLGLYSAERLDVKEEACMLSVLMDISELRKMEAELTRLDRLNLVGEMAASIGHEIRNPMTTVRGYLQLLQQNDLYHGEIEYFDLMIEELDRANSIITEFLSLAKNKVVELELTGLNTIINKLMPLVQAKAMSRDQYIRLEMANKLPFLMLDHKEIRQLILNLVNNGMEAMAAGGCVTIKTYIEQGRVVLAINDNGMGIDGELLYKLGTPFFTTKEQGTGLGLAVCYRIAARHNAYIDIETGPTGTTFYVRFPTPEGGGSGNVTAPTF